MSTPLRSMSIPMFLCPARPVLAGLPAGPQAWLAACLPALAEPQAIPTEAPTPISQSYVMGRGPARVASQAPRSDPAGRRGGVDKCRGCGEERGRARE